MLVEGYYVYYTRNIYSITEGFRYDKNVAFDRMFKGRCVEILFQSSLLRLQARSCNIKSLVLIEVTEDLRLCTGKPLFYQILRERFKLYRMSVDNLGHAAEIRTSIRLVIDLLQNNEAIPCNVPFHGHCIYVRPYISEYLLNVHNPVAYRMSLSYILNAE